MEAAAQAVLDARAQYPTSTLADLYDPLAMPAPLLKAHQQLDRAVDRVASARVRDGDLAGAVVLAPDYGSKDED